MIEARTKQRNSMEYFENGILKSHYFGKRTKVLTPLGEMDAEMITYYDDGSVHRVFPLYGQVSGFWSEVEEIKLADSLGIEYSCYCFYKSGKLKSLTLYQDKKIEIETPLGKVNTRFGVSYYESGEVKSFEPPIPLLIATPIGEILAYDNNPVGIHGDRNSVEFFENGKLKSVSTLENNVSVINPVGISKLIKPPLVRSDFDIEKFVVKPMKINFFQEGIEIVRCKEKQLYLFDSDSISVLKWKM